jgi:allantoin racemase
VFVDATTLNGVSVLVAGAGLAGLAAKLASKVEVPLLDGIACAISTAEGLAAQKPAKARTGRLSKTAPVESVGLTPALARLIGR